MCWAAAAGAGAAGGGAVGAGAAGSAASGAATATVESAAASATAAGASTATGAAASSGSSFMSSSGLSSYQTGGSTLQQINAITQTAGTAVKIFSQKRAMDAQMDVARANKRATRELAQSKIYAASAQASRRRAQQSFQEESQKAVISARGQSTTSGSGEGLIYNSRVGAVADIRAIMHERNNELWALSAKRREFEYQKDLARSRGRFAIASTVVGFLTQSGGSAFSG